MVGYVGPMQPATLVSLLFLLMVTENVTENSSVNRCKWEI